MIDYKNGKIYQIVSEQTDKVYIGSTTQKLCKRMSDHRATMRLSQCGITSKEILQFSDARILLIEEYPCDNKEQLLKREGEVMKTFENRVNKKIAGNMIGKTQKEYDKQFHIDNIERMHAEGKAYRDRNREAIREKKKEYDKANREMLAVSRKEYRQTNKEAISERKKEYRAKNQEDITAKRKIPVTCEICKKTVLTHSMPSHEKSQKHLANIAKLTPTIN